MFLLDSFGAEWQYSFIPAACKGVNAPEYHDQDYVHAAKQFAPLLDSANSVTS